MTFILQDPSVIGLETYAPSDTEYIFFIGLRPRESPTVPRCRFRSKPSALLQNVRMDHMDDMWRRLYQAIRNNELQGWISHTRVLRRHPRESSTFQILCRHNDNFELAYRPFYYSVMHYVNFENDAFMYDVCAEFRIDNDHGVVFHSYDSSRMQHESAGYFNGPYFVPDIPLDESEEIQQNNIEVVFEGLL